MTKTLSEQLCEIVGLEYENKMFLSDSEVECTYLDFERPENFVKLWKLIINIEGFYFSSGNPYIGIIPSYQKYSLLEDNNHNCYFSKLNGLKGFLECLIQHAKNDEDTRNYIRDYDGWVWG